MHGGEINAGPLLDARPSFPLTHRGEGQLGAFVKRLHAPRSTRHLYVAAIAVLAAVAYVRSRPRSPSLPLETSIDGPAPAAAAGVLVFLHGRGGSITRGAEIVKRLRGAGLPADFSIVLLEGPFGTLFGHAWGNDAAEQATSRARVRARLADLLGAHGPEPARVVLVGFSQGAGVAADVATEEPRVGAVASFSPCAFWLRGALPQRTNLRVLLAHGTRDSVCPVNESRSLAAVLKDAEVPVQYLEFDGEHKIPPEVIGALVAFATAK